MGKSRNPAKSGCNLGLQVLQVPGAKRLAALALAAHRRRLPTALAVKAAEDGRAPLHSVGGSFAQGTGVHLAQAVGQWGAGDPNTLCGI